MEDQHFWDDAEQSSKVIKEAKVLKNTIDSFKKLQTLYDDVETLIEMGYEEEDESIVLEVKETYEQLKAQLDNLTKDCESEKPEN
jgi:peptide chain release factor 2